ncbi:RNI-like protein [Piedraia hortae CBS 480.64]|uniref:RNI-like protein n=1 Tax=Piedraia hortae CBS 480.64 TaxID=1314780 RepID=A0A6A7BT19_9PEZI|nr:RNI-like protein [Piedraia hortae CBS 480.64]
MPSTSVAAPRQPYPPLHRSALPPLPFSLRNTPHLATTMGTSATSSRGPSSAARFRSAVTMPTALHLHRPRWPWCESAVASLTSSGRRAVTPSHLHTITGEHSRVPEHGVHGVDVSWLHRPGPKSSPLQKKQPQPPQQPPQQPRQQKAPITPPKPTGDGGQEEVERPEPLNSAKAKDANSFFSSLTRRKSTGSLTHASKSNRKCGVPQRCVLNVDPNRPRHCLPELNPGSLRKVSFCVDVEVVGYARPACEGTSQENPNSEQQTVRSKLSDRAEGETLKQSRSLTEEKEADGGPTSGERDNGTSDGDSGQSSPGSSPPTATSRRKKEKKKKLEEERKVRQENKRRMAIEQGSVPVIMPNPPTDGAPTSVPLPDAPIATPADHPTTNPVRIYRRCCQLRETPILRRITEQLMDPRAAVASEPGVVGCLNLTRSRLQPADFVTLGDWLAVVPVKRLILEDADMGDESLRCILAGLLAAKRPEAGGRRLAVPRHRERLQPKLFTERSGVVEKLVLKNNPRISGAGWRHICLFLYMCRSIKSLDLSMNSFPETLGMEHLPSSSDTHDAADIFSRCVAERPGGRRLEELLMSECGLTSGQIRKVVDGAIVCGTSRLGLAGHQIDDEGLQYVIHYIRSGVCQALDIGGNDLRGRVATIAAALPTRHESDIPFWGLGLAGCNLVASDLKQLFPAIARLPEFLFLDLSHNPELCMTDDTITLFRQYMSHFKNLKRLHLADVNMSPRQAIALADCLPDGPRLAHLNILENPQLQGLASATSEALQEEACALYASLMAAARVSGTLICIDVDVPSNDNSEVVKALAKQVVAYSLRNLERFTVAEATGAESTSGARMHLDAHGGKQDITVPDVLMHLVGHVEGADIEAASSDSYIVGGTGVVKALQYVLGEKVNDLQGRPSSAASPEACEEQRVKAKKVSKNLLGSARKIRQRLQPALAAETDEISFRRLLFVDQTLQSMIQRFEQEYPETRETETWPVELGPDEDAEDASKRPPSMQRSGSQVSLAARAQTQEEGRSHNLDDAPTPPDAETAQMQALWEDVHRRLSDDQFETNVGRHVL